MQPPSRNYPTLLCKMFGFGVLLLFGDGGVCVCVCVLLLWFSWKRVPGFLTGRSWRFMKASLFNVKALQLVSFDLL